MDADHPANGVLFARRSTPEAPQAMVARGAQPTPTDGEWTAADFGGALTTAASQSASPSSDFSHSSDQTDSEQSSKDDARIAADRAFQHQRDEAIEAEIQETRDEADQALDEARQAKERVEAERYYQTEATLAQSQ